jgi:hypothetical protein
MDAVVSLTGQGGWPLSVFLTPEQQPFYGGTYFPPTQRYNMPAFRDVLMSVAKTWQDDRDRLLQAGTQITDYISKNQSLPGSSTQLKKDVLDQAASTLAETYDWEHGGWGQAPKFPQPMAIEFLLRRGTRGDKQSLDIAVHALRSMAKGGMYDLIGGGFARYSTDEIWLVPHFEKMLYDNAQLAQAYLHAYLITGDDDLRRVCEETLDFIMREMTHPAGGFYSSLDADSEGIEGKFYVWTEQEIRDVLDNESDAELILTAYGITQTGNFEGQSIPRRVIDDEKLANKFDLDNQAFSSRFQAAKTKLLEAREKRVRPATDDKVLLAWNSLMVVVFIEAWRYLGISEYGDMATRNLNFMLGSMLENGRLFRSWRKDKARHTAYLEDYAALILALINMYNSDPDPSWFSSAVNLTDEMIEHFFGSDGLFYDTADDHENLLVRPRDLQDNAIPSGNALATNALLLLSAYQGDGKMRDMAEKMLARVQGSITKYPTAFGKWLYALDIALHTMREIAILGNFQDERMTALVETLWAHYRPDVIAAISHSPPAPDGPALLNDRPLLNAAPTVYICEGFVCKQPVNDVDHFSAQLNTEHNK